MSLFFANGKSNFLEIKRLKDMKFSVNNRNECRIVKLLTIGWWGILNGLLILAYISVTFYVAKMKFL